MRHPSQDCKSGCRVESRTVSISIAICTHNRAQSLRACLRSFVRAADECDVQFELIVIDNACTDRTPAVVDEFVESLPLRYLLEPRLGLSRARNRALRVFEGDWLVFTDDDVEIDPDWLDALARAIDDCPGMDFFGGRCLVRWPEHPPPWLHEPANTPFIQGLIGHYDLGSDTRPLREDDMLPFGLNMGFSRRCLQSLAPFRVDLGAGTGTRGEDTDMLARARAAGFNGWYLADARVHHLGQRERLNLLALYRHGVAKGRTHALLGELGSGSVIEEIAQLIRGAMQGLLGRGDRMRVCIVNAGIERGLRKHAQRSSTN